MLLNKRIPLSYIFKKVKVDIILVMLFTIAIIIAKQYLHIPFELNATIPAGLGTAITLVLAFKLNQSYDRWWEARKIWGSIVNDSRTLIIQLLNFTDDHSRREIKENAFRQIAWCYGLANSLRKTGDYSRLEQFLSKEEFESLKNSSNVPLKIANYISGSIKKLRKDREINEFQQIQMDSTIVRLVASMGKAERIKGTIFPKTYRMFLTFFVYIFLLTLAISLTELHPAFEVPLLVTISCPYFLLTKTSVYMQDPFEDLPTDTAMTAISETIETNIKELIEDDSAVFEKSEFKFYKM